MLCGKLHFISESAAMTLLVVSICIDCFISLCSTNKLHISRLLQK